MDALCRDCLADVPPDGARCPACGGSRILVHPELGELTIAHLDCDAFYAAVEKRDDPSLDGKPLIVGGGGQRGVVATACYEARKFGVKSAMPMFQALKLCPHAVVIRPTMSKYAAVARDIRAMLLSLTPLVEPLSLDEAYLDLSGTARLHGMAPAKTMAALAKRIEQRIGITVSVGLSHNKFLAKLASDLEKPRGFAVIGRAEAKDFLRERSIAIIRGVGPVLEKRLSKDGILAHRPASGHERAQLGGSLWRNRPLAPSPGKWRGPPRRRTRRRSQERIGRDDVRGRYCEIRRTGTHPVGSGRARLRAGEGGWHWRTACSACSPTSRWRSTSR